MRCCESKRVISTSTEPAQTGPYFTEVRSISSLKVPQYGKNRKTSPLQMTWHSTVALQINCESDGGGSDDYFHPFERCCISIAF